VVVGGSKTTDEEMLKSAREVVYDEKIAYLENVKHFNIKELICSFISFSFYYALFVFFLRILL